MSEECRWCAYNKGVCKESALVKQRCDFKDLPFENGAIMERMRVEKAYLDLVVKEKDRVDEARLRVAMDKAAGMVIMSKVLIEEFGVSKSELRKALGSKELSWSERAKLALMVKLMQKGRKAEG